MPAECGSLSVFFWAEWCEVAVAACLTRCWRQVLSLVCFRCRWVGVTLKTFPASLTLSLSSTQTCHYLLHLCGSSVQVCVCGKKKKKKSVFLQPSCYLQSRYVSKRHADKNEIYPHLTNFRPLEFTSVRDTKVAGMVRIWCMKST